MNAGIQAQGTGLPCAAHTDASLLTLIVAPSQPGLELFATPHPHTPAAAAAAAEAYATGLSSAGATAAGAESEGEWMSGFEVGELTREEAEGGGRREELEEPLALVAMGGDMLVHATGAISPDLPQLHPP